jgi:predicted NUDIX family NTP pyrophosphohydrolase
MIRPRSSLSAGIIAYRRAPDGLEVLLVHPGGPFWRNRDAGAWSIPKGGVDPGEDHLTAGVREFQEETGTVLAGDFLPLGEIRQAGGKRVVAFAIEADIDADAITSNTFSMEWPPKSGKLAQFPEVDRAAWFDFATARAKINPAQAMFLERLVAALGKQAAS